MAEYQEAFEALSAPLPQLSDEVLECAFLNGLDPVVRAEVLAIEPKDLDEIMRRTQLIEDIATAVQEAGVVDWNTEVGAMASKAAAKPLEIMPTRMVTLTNRVGTATVTGTAPAT